MADAREIAAKLSGAEIATLLSQDRVGYSCWPQTTHKVGSFCPHGRRLMDHRLIEWHPDWRKTMTTITPLGLQVRTILQQKEPA